MVVETTKTGRNKGKKQQIIFEDTIHNDVVDVDSIEEWYTFAFITELYQLGLIKDFTYQPESFPLTPKFTYDPATLKDKKLKEAFLFHPHVYTADFMFTVFLDNEDILKWFKQVFKISQQSLRIDNETQRTVADIWIDVKGTWMHGADSFSINQKLVFDKHGIYISKFVPKQVFQKLGVPKLATKTPSGRPSKVFGNMKFIETHLKEYGINLS